MACQYDPIDEPYLFSRGLEYSEVQSVLFFHPGYSGADGTSDFDVLLSLEAFDDAGTGVHYDTAHTACAILANNRWDGYFSDDRHGRLKAQPPDGILRKEQYYFCLPSSDPSTHQYPVIARFKDWRFPHGNLPPIWKKLKDQLKTLVPQFQRTVTPPSLDDAGCHDQHISSQGNSNLRQDNDGQSQADSLLPVRSHSRRDSRGPDDEPKEEPVHVVGHVFNSTPSGDLPQLWHNRPLCSPPSPSSVEYLFARFAYTIFSPSVFKYFLDSNKARRLLIWDEGKLKHEIEDADPERCRSIWNASRSRSESPKKRARSTGNGQQDDDGEYRPGPLGTASDEDSAYHDDSPHLAEFASEPDEPERGRRRKRKSDEYSGRTDLNAAKRSRLDL
ncbi:hypothetical protein AK830_g41 [Neonectria ditissima]|uniref:HNH nuclease domain-containing protein n=1 Tax=Neonectria ditissima TaxID=78410 RepID=A0A0P7BZA9_9HYPO|nr:hypothetical protein AK830_g41 [Neonectria ditissima]